MRTRLLALLLVTPLGACAVPAVDSPPAAPAAPPAFSPPAASSPRPASPSPAKHGPANHAPAKKKKPPARHAGSYDPRFGTQYAFLRSGNVSTQRVTYDLVYWFDGDQAVKACREDAVKPAENDYCTGWYIRNKNPKLRTLTLDPDAPIRIDAKTVDLRTFLRDIPRGSVIKFDVDAGRMMSLSRVYLP